MKRLIIFTLACGVLAMTVSSCGTRKGCNTRGKKQVDMGWM